MVNGFLVFYNVIMGQCVIGFGWVGYKFDFMVGDFVGGGIDIMCIYCDVLNVFVIVFVQIVYDLISFVMVFIDWDMDVIIG